MYGAVYVCRAVRRIKYYLSHVNPAITALILYFHSGQSPAKSPQECSSVSAISFLKTRQGIFKNIIFQATEDDPSENCC